MSLLTLMNESVRVTVEEIRLRNFRAFENARLTLSDLTFLVGRNGAGKSSLLDAMDLLRESVGDSLENALDRRGGLQKVQCAKPDCSGYGGGNGSGYGYGDGSGNGSGSGDGKGYGDGDGSGSRSVHGVGKINPAMGMALVFRIDFAGSRQTRAVYGFEIQEKQDGGTPHIRECFISSKQSTFRRDEENFDGESGVSPPAGNLILPLIARSDSLWDHVLDTIRNIRSYELSPAHMAAAPEIGERSTLARDGANAGDALKAVEGTSAHQWIVERLGTVTAGIVDVRAEAFLGRRVLRFFQKLENGELSFDARQVSQGTLRSLGVLLALRQKPAPSVVLVDEIENSVHPSALAVLLDAALASCAGTRVVLTSHSPEVLSHPSVTGERVRLVEWRDGVSRIFRLSPETQASVNEIDTVGWMLRSNALWTGPDPETLEGDLFALEGVSG